MPLKKKNWLLRVLSSSQNWEEGWETGVGSSQRETRNNWHSATGTVRSSQLPLSLDDGWHRGYWHHDCVTMSPLASEFCAQHLWTILSGFYVLLSHLQNGKGSAYDWLCLDHMASHLWPVGKHGSLSTGEFPPNQRGVGSGHLNYRNTEFYPAVWAFYTQSISIYCLSHKIFYHFACF